jgi:hypothetical protein
MKKPEYVEADDFSIVLGGPFFQLLRRARLTGEGLQLLHWRIVIIPLLAWLPLLLFSALEGHALGKSVPVPFLLDIAAQVRFLVALPLLILAERVVHERMRSILAQFRERHLIPAGASDRFKSAIDAAMRLRNSIIAEALLIIFVFVVGTQYVWRYYVALPTATWYAVPSAEGLKLSLSGIWYCFLSTPLFQFLMLRWYFRIFIWARFLWQLSRISLSLIPTHPDRMGGLGFLPQIIYAFIPLAVAQGALLSGLIADRIFHTHAALPEFKGEIVLVVAIMLGLVLGPLLVFVPQLAHAKRRGLREYGQLAEGYAREFDEKWLRHQAPADEPLMGSGDIQSLADLGNSFSVVQEMQVTLFTKESIITIAVVTLVPIMPLVLTMMPLEELLKKLVGLIV